MHNADHSSKQSAALEKTNMDECKKPTKCVNCHKQLGSKDFSINGDNEDEKSKQVCRACLDGETLSQDNNLQIRKQANDTASQFSYVKDDVSQSTQANRSQKTSHSNNDANSTLTRASRFADDELSTKANVSILHIHLTDYCVERETTCRLEGYRHTTHVRNQFLPNPKISFLQEYGLTRK